MLRGAIVGFGEVARFGHWPAYASSREAQIIAVVDRTAGRRELARGLSPPPATYATLAALEDAAAIDFVDICTPPAFHPEAMLEAIDRGWHVLCEKPLVLDRQALDTVRDRAASRGVAVVPVDNWKYAPIVLAATRALRSGAIGSLRRVEIETVRVRAASTAGDRASNWRRDPAIGGGGIVMDHGWHAIYLVLHWFAAAAIGVEAAVRREGSQVEDEARITLEFPAGDARIALTWNGGERRNAMRLIGDDGEIVIADDVLHVSGAAPQSAAFAPALSAGSHHADWFDAMLPAAFACFRNPALAVPLLDEAAECLSIIAKIYGSDLTLAAPQ
jgi:predicted dehydrogenase